MKPSSIHCGLSKEQEAIVKHINGPVLVLAGAGAGKTMTVTRRISYMIDRGIPPSSIVAVTFTNKAAGEMRSRIADFINDDVLVATFHGLGLRILRMASSLGFIGRINGIYDAQDSESLIESVIKELKIKANKKSIKSIISSAKNSSSLSIESAIETAMAKSCEEVSSFVVQSIARMYDSKMRSLGVVDYDDLIRIPVELLKTNKAFLEHLQGRWQYFSVDEYQDTNPQQAILIKLLAGGSENVCAVGDPDQAIYSWRGANIDNILNFTSDYIGAKSFMLNTNYRCSRRVVDVANALIQNNSKRVERQLQSGSNIVGSVKIIPSLDGFDEARSVIHFIRRFVSGGCLASDCAVLYRANFQSRVFEDVFMREKISYKIYGGISFYQRKEIKDAISFLRLSVNGNDIAALNRSIALCKMGIGQVSVRKLFGFAEAAGSDLISFLDDCIKSDKLPIKISEDKKAMLSAYISNIVMLRKIVLSNGIVEAVGFIVSSSYICSLIIDVKEDKTKQDERKTNLKELFSKSKQWQDMSVEEFLEEMALRADTEEDSVDIKDKVVMMTLHNAKGLEFRNVFMVGMESGLFPYTSTTETIDLEEERRLCYVGITRAKENLILSFAQERFLWGKFRSREGSVFLEEIA